MLDHGGEESFRSKRSGGNKAALVKLAVCVSVLLSISLAWRLTPLKDSVDFESIIRWQQSLKDHPSALFWVVAAYLVGGLVLFPVMALNVATIVTFGPVLGNAYAFVGWICSAASGFGIARVVGRDMVQKLARSRIQHLLHSAGRHGFLTVLGMRLLPVAPFTVVNLFVGASGIRFMDFLLATIVGRLPGIVTLSLFGVQLESFLEQPDMASLVLLALSILLIPLVTVWLCKRFASHGMGRENIGRENRTDS